MVDILEIAAIERRYQEHKQEMMRRWPELSEQEKLKFIKAPVGHDREFLRREAFSPKRSKVRDECRRKLWQLTWLQRFGEHWIEGFGKLTVILDLHLDHLGVGESNLEWLGTELNKLQEAANLDDGDIVPLLMFIEHHFANNLSYYIGTAVRELLEQSIEAACNQVFKEPKRRRVLPKLKRHFFIDVRGRPIGKRKLKSVETDTAELEKRAALILQAIRQLPQGMDAERKKEIAKQLGRHPKTLRRWLKDLEEVGVDFDQLLSCGGRGDIEKTKEIIMSIRRHKTSK